MNTENSRPTCKDCRNARHEIDFCGEMWCMENKTFVSETDTCEKAEEEPGA